MELGGLLESGASRSLCSKKTERPSRTEGPNTSSGAVMSILQENHCASGTSERPASPFFFLKIVAVLGQQGAAENERGILWTVTEWTHQTPLVWHSSLSFPQSQVGPTFCARNMSFPCTYAWLWDWEMLRTIFNCNWVSSVEFSWLRVVWCPQTSLYPQLGDIFCAVFLSGCDVQTCTLCVWTYVGTHAWGCALLAQAVMSTIHRTCGFQVANSFPEVTCSLASVQKLSNPTGLMEMYQKFARKLVQII